MSRTRIALTAVLASVALVVAMVGLAAAATLTLSMNTGDSAHVICPTNGKLTRTVNRSYDWTLRCRATTTPAPTSTAPTTATSVPTSATTATTPPLITWDCSVPIGQNCGPYGYDGIPMSNGYDTYVANQGVDVHGTEVVNANSPGDWQVVANLADCGGCVQTFPDAQQLTNDWNGSGWGGSGTSDTPWRSLSTLSVTYDETSPQTGASYEFAPDVWGPGPWDIMFWVDTHGRCNEGAFGPVVLGHPTFGGQNWTAHQYGDEIILVLDGPGGPGTCAQQSSGTIDIKAGLDWLWNGGFITGTTLQQLNTGWEITQASNATFRMNSYSVQAQ